MIWRLYHCLTFRELLYHQQEIHLVQKKLKQVLHQSALIEIKSGYIRFSEFLAVNHKSQKNILYSVKVQLVMRIKISISLSSKNVFLFPS